MVMRSAVVALLLAGTLALPSTSGADATADEDPSDVWLLPKSVFPTSYDLTLRTHLDKFDDANADFKFEGCVVILVVVKSAVDGIVLHKSADMQIKKATLTKDSDTRNLTFIDFDTKTNKMTLKLVSAQKISSGNYKVTIEYIGYHSEDMHGFYRSSYINSENMTRWLLTTQFESYDARRAFPCFDEPEFKANYKISIIIPKTLQEDGYHVLSNMPLDGVVKPDPIDANFSIYKFQETSKLISSYLIAFIVSDFQSTSDAFFEGGTKPFHTWAQRRPIIESQGAVSQLAGPAALDVMAKFTSVPYGYPKVDQVGIPDFNAGAMENWGLVTYRERNILYDEKIHPISQKQSVVVVTAHELAHQWFGDLVTLHWWSDIWLNEGFANFFEFHASDQINVTGLDTSSWKLLNQMVVNELQSRAFSTDAQPNSRALTTLVYTPGEIDANFDGIAYSKGGSVIRMWMHTLGQENFYKALHNYLQTYQEKVATPENLLAEFAKVVPSDLAGVLKPCEDFRLWHVQAGYPVLHVKRNGNVSVLTQERFLVSGENAGKSKWTVPITMTTSKKPNFADTKPLAANIFKSTADKITIYHGVADWVIFNVQQTGFYRVNYNADGWEALKTALIANPNDFHEINRAQLLDDAMCLARSTLNYGIKYDVALSMTRFLKKETELVPWKAAINAFNFLYGKLGPHPTLGPKMNNLILDRVEGIFNILTLIPNTTHDAHTRRLLRPLVASLACKLGQKQCVEKAKELFAAYMTGPDSPIHPDVKSTVLCTGLRQSSDEDIWNTLWSHYLQATDNSEQTIFLTALGCSKSPQIVLNFLKKTIDPISKEIRRQDNSAVFSSVYNGNFENIPVALQFLSDNLEKIADTYSGMDPLGGLLTGIAENLGTENDLATIVALRDRIMASSIEKVHNGLTGAMKAVDIVTANKAWLDQKQESINIWLDSDENDAKRQKKAQITGGAATTTLALLLLFVSALLSITFAF